MISVVGNLRINSLSRLNHFKDSFLSFHQLSDNWVINIRGTYRTAALEFIRQRLTHTLIEHSLLDDTKGWAVTTLAMMADVKYDYVLLWNEDHVNVANPDIFPQLIQEITTNAIDCLSYTWYHVPQDLGVPIATGTHIDTYWITPATWATSLGKNPSLYIISSPSIFRKSLLEKLLWEDIQKWPWPLARIVRKISHLMSKLLATPSSPLFYKINSNLFSDRLPRFTKETPFNLEKEPHRTDYLPLRFGLLRQELFACIDDDLGTPGSSLLARAPERLCYSKQVKESKETSTHDR